VEQIPLQHDPRWILLNSREWTCPSCGEPHNGPFDLACGKPDPWPGQDGPNDYVPNSAVLSSRNFLSEDFCVLNDEHFFVRCVLRLPIIGADRASFGYGTWSTLSRKNFELYTDHFDEGKRADLGSWFGWFSNRLNGYPDTVNLKCHVHPQDNRQRPLIELEPTDHPLAREQREGITFDRLLEIYALHGHDIRAALSS
jgi:hypothetical protein